MSRCFFVQWFWSLVRWVAEFCYGSWLGVVSISSVILVLQFYIGMPNPLRVGIGGPFRKRDDVIAGFS